MAYNSHRIVVNISVLLNLLRFSDTNVHPEMMNVRQHSVADMGETSNFIDTTLPGNLNHQNNLLTRQTALETLNYHHKIYSYIYI